MLTSLRLRPSARAAAWSYSMESTGIGGSQTGIYPLDSPGGWQLLGLTPVKTYDPNREIPILFEAGDYIHFVPVTEKDFLEIKEQVNQGTYECVIRQKGV